MQDFQKPPEKQEQQTSSDCPYFTTCLNGPMIAELSEFVDERKFTVPETTKSPWTIWDILLGHQIGDVESPGFCFRRSSRSQLWGCLD